MTDNKTVPGAPGKRPRVELHPDVPAGALTPPPADAADPAHKSAGEEAALPGDVLGVGGAIATCGAAMTPEPSA